MIDKIKNIRHIDSNNFFLIAGPCAIEGKEMAFEIAEKIKEITDRLKIPFIFKGSYRKANRSRLDSFTGIGDGKDFDESGAGKIANDIFSAENMAKLEKQAKAAGVSVTDFINNLFKTKDK